MVELLQVLRPRLARHGAAYCGQSGDEHATLRDTLIWIIHTCVVPHLDDKREIARPSEILHGEVECVLPGALDGQARHYGKVHGVAPQHWRGEVGEGTARVWVGGDIGLVVRQAALEERPTRLATDTVPPEPVAAGAVAGEAQVVVERADLQLKHARRASPVWY